MWFLQALVAMAVVDFFWCYTTRQVSKNRFAKALISNAMLVISQGVVTISYVEFGFAIVVPAVIGSAMGLTAAFLLDRSK